jgi:hypothetical protein
MKWTVLLILAIALFVFWPKDEARSPISSTKQKSVSVQQSSTERRRSGGHSTSSGLQKATTKDLEEEILSQWPEIESGLPALDQRIAKFIRTLRELGTRDGPGTLDFLDQLGSFLLKFEAKQQNALQTCAASCPAKEKLS